MVGGIFEITSADTKKKKADRQETKLADENDSHVERFICAALVATSMTANCSANVQLDTCGVHLR